MTVVPFLPTNQWRNPLLIGFADMQLEYLSTGRAYSIGETTHCLSACTRLLSRARELRLPIVHFRQVRSDIHFNGASPFAKWIDGFEPRASEMVYERSRPSCYANEDFAALLDGISHPALVLAGLSGDQACLATAIDACHRNHRLIFVADGSATPAFGSLSEDASHEALCHIVARYAEVLTVEQLMYQMARADADGLRWFGLATKDRQGERLDQNSF